MKILPSKKKSKKQFEEISSDHEILLKRKTLFWLECLNLMKLYSIKLHLGPKQSTRRSAQALQNTANRTILRWSGMTDTAHNSSYQREQTPR